MRWEITQSEKSSSSLIQADNSYEYTHRAYTESTFPKWFREAGFSASKDFFNCIDKGIAKTFKKPTIRFKRLESIALERLKHGYENKHGFDKPSELYDEIPF